MSRKQAREQTFKLIFEYVFRNEQNPLTKEDFLLYENFEKEDEVFISESYEGVVKHYDELLAIIEKNLKNYTLNRIYKVDLAILLLAVYEIKISKATAFSIVINEAVELSKKYSTDKSFKFINGVLASILGDSDGE